jgi:hypothetical protein
MSDNATTETSSTPETTGTMPPPNKYDNVDEAAIAVTMESTRLHLSTWLARIQHHVSIEKIRPLTVFLGLQNAASTSTTIETSVEEGMMRHTIAPDAYTAPNGSTYQRTYQLIQIRIQENMSYYLSNYVFIVVMTSIVIVLMHPSMIFTGMLVYGLFLLHTYLIRHEVMILRSSNVSIQTLLTVQQRFYLIGSIAFLLVLLTCIIPTLFIITISSTIIFTHAILRNSSNSQDISSSQRNDGNQNNNDGSEVDPLLSPP